MKVFDCSAFTLYLSRDQMIMSPVLQLSLLFLALLSIRGKQQQNNSVSINHENTSGEAE